MNQEITESETEEQDELVVMDLPIATCEAIERGAADVGMPVEDFTTLLVKEAVAAKIAKG